MLETCNLPTVHNVPHITIQKGGYDVKLTYRHTKVNSDGEEYSQRVGHANGGVGVIVINAFDLVVPEDDPSSLEANYTIVFVPFLVKHPHTP